MSEIQKTLQFENVHEIYIYLFFSHQNKTLFNDKTKGAHISYKLFSIAAFF